MFDEMSHWSRLCGMLKTSPELILMLDSRSEDVAREGAEQRRKSGSDQGYCRNLPKDVCNVRKQLAVLQSTYNLPSIASEITENKHLHDGLHDFMSFVKDECAR